MKDEEVTETQKVEEVEVKEEEAVAKIDHGVALLDSKDELSSLEEEETKVST
jgi:hypothetical protein